MVHLKKNLIPSQIVIDIDEDYSTPPPLKKQRISSSSDSDVHKTQSTNDGKSDEQNASASPSTSLPTLTPKSDEKNASSSKCIENDDQKQDDEVFCNRTYVNKLGEKSFAQKRKSSGDNDSTPEKKKR